MNSEIILVVGAGFAGAAMARTLAEHGLSVLVIDKRPHVAGNAFDEITSSGIRVHRYGPHLFHTSNDIVVRWLSRFTEWTHYEHRVTAKLKSGCFVPLPINRRTIEVVFSRSFRTARDAEMFVSSQVAKLSKKPGNANEYLISKIGPTLTNIFFSPYTEKMWGYRLNEVDASVVKRIPIRFDDEDRYFPNDSFQALPTLGYTKLIENVLDHPNISVSLDTPFLKTMIDEFCHSFLCSPIDEFFDYKLGHLPYRSIRFHHRSIPRAEVDGLSATVNYTNDGPFTRSTYWHLLPKHDLLLSPNVIETSEEPCDYVDNNMERYYPVQTADGCFQARYSEYKSMALNDPRITFIGRCGTYKYLDMHQVINQTLSIANDWLSKRLQKKV